VFVKQQNFTTKNNKINMEKRIVVDEPMFIGICKRGFIQVDKDTQVSFTSREVSHLCQGRILDKEVVGWSENINFKFALQDIGYDMINEILKRSPLFGYLVGIFLK
jgi:hypothetical protein